MFPEQILFNDIKGYMPQWEMQLNNGCPTPVMTMVESNI